MKTEEMNGISPFQITELELRKSIRTKFLNPLNGLIGESNFLVTELAYLCVKEYSLSICIMGKIWCTINQPSGTTFHFTISKK